MGISHLDYQQQKRILVRAIALQTVRSLQKRNGQRKSSDSRLYHSNLRNRIGMNTHNVLQVQVDRKIELNWLVEALQSELAKCKANSAKASYLQTQIVLLTEQWHDALA
jgi:hypothetical protein